MKSSPTWYRPFFARCDALFRDRKDRLTRGSRSLDQDLFSYHRFSGSNGRAQRMSRCIIIHTALTAVTNNSMCSVRRWCYLVSIIPYSIPYQLQTKCEYSFRIFTIDDWDTRWRRPCYFWFLLYQIHRETLSCYNGTSYIKLFWFVVLK